MKIISSFCYCVSRFLLIQNPRIPDHGLNAKSYVHSSGAVVWAQKRGEEKNVGDKRRRGRHRQRKNIEGEKAKAGALELGGPGSET